MAPQKPSFGLPLGTKVHKCWKLRSPKKLLKNKLSKMSECNQNGCPNGGVQIHEWVFLATNFETLPQTGARRALTPQNHRFSYKIIDSTRQTHHTVTQKLTHLGSPSSLLATRGELVGPNLAPSVPVYVSSFSFLISAESHAHALSTHF